MSLSKPTALGLFSVDMAQAKASYMDGTDVTEHRPINPILRLAAS